MKSFDTKANMKLFKKCLCMFLVLTSMLSMLSIASSGLISAASASDYISETYAANLSVKTTVNTELMDLPVSSGAATVKYTVPAKTMLTVNALYKNTSGEYFYKILYYDMTLYVDAKDTILADHLTGDMTFTGAQSPAVLKYGSGFPIKGNISSTLNDIGTVSASMHEGADITKIPAITASDNANGKSYSLASSAVDNDLWFNLLSPGVYRYVVSAEAVSYYIDDNDNLASSKVDVVLENKQCVVTDQSSPNPSLHEGIDVSVWNGNIDWTQVKNQVDFVVIRASWEETADENFHTNAQGCRDNGIPFGVYVYSYAENKEEAIGEAEYVMSLVSGYDLDLPIYFDFEDEIQMNLSASLQREIVKAFCDTIYAGGYQPGVYTYKWILDSVLTDSYFRTIPTWVAEINGASYTSYTGGLTMWQYSWVGRFSGMSGDVDCNHMYVDLPGTNSCDTSYTSRCTYYPSNLNVTLTYDVDLREYPASGYDLLDTIPAGTVVHATGIYKNTYDNYWYQVEYNGKTGYVYWDSAEVNEYRYDDIAIMNPDMASNLAVGKGYYIGGELVSRYNELSTVYAKTYSGENTMADPILSSNYSPNSKEYSLYKSEVDYGLLFGTQPEDYYTYEVSVDAKNYYVVDNTLYSKTENVVLWTKPYTVGNATATPPESIACVHNIVTTPAVAPDCISTGLTEGTHCSKCGEVITPQSMVAATGHSYSVTHHDATCIKLACDVFTCSKCGDSYTREYMDKYSEWQESKPEGVEENLIDTKTQYRHSNYSTIKNYETSVDGYTLINKEWESQGAKTLEYVKEWPSGFNTSNSLYSKYNVTPKTDYTDTYYTKTEVNSDEIVGYLYYHWCRGSYTAGPINRTTTATKDDTHVAFQAFYSTADPKNAEQTSANGSVKIPNGDACKDAWWWYYTPVYRQTYTDYKALYTHSIWSEWSEWSDTEYEELWNQKVETRTMYRYLTGGTYAPHNYVNGACSVCGEPQPEQDMYLFGYINGVDYADKADSENTGIYKFVDGKLTVTFTEDSYVGVKTESNSDWYMTNGYLGNVSAALLYNTKVLGADADKLFVPKNREVTFTLKRNGNDTYVLSYTFAPCVHESHDINGKCAECGEVVKHSYDDGTCTVCGKVCEHKFANGMCIICGTLCEHSWTANGSCAICSAKCKHTWVEGICSTCGNTCEHNWKNGTCAICTLVCEHDFVNGSCEICGNTCDHSWENGNCTECDKTCDHSFKDGTCTICSFVCKHLWEDGICKDCSVLCKHTWENGVCVTCGKTCEHNWSTGGCTICGSDCDHKFEDGTCTLCGEVCDTHHYDGGACIVCGRQQPQYYLFGYINGRDYGFGDDIENVGEYKFENGTLKATFTDISYVAVKTGDNKNLYMTNGYIGDGNTTAVLYDSQLLGSKADKLYVPKGREITFNLIDNGDETFILYYTVAPCKHEGHNTNGLCSSCGAVMEHTWENGSCVDCGCNCSHSFKDSKCEICGLACNHRWVDGVCAVCSAKCEHNFTDNVCSTCGKACKHNFKDAVCTDCGYECEHHFEGTVCTICGLVCDHSWDNGTCTNCGCICTHDFENGECKTCGYFCGHDISNGSCKVCLKNFEYYLAGYIDGVNVGCEENFEKSGDYCLSDGDITLNLDSDSYIFVKTKNNENWYFTDSANSSKATFRNAKTASASEMMYLPAGTAVTITAVLGDDDTVELEVTIDSCNHAKHDKDGICTICSDVVEHSYEDGKCTDCGSKEPEKAVAEFNLKYIDLSYEEDVRYSVHFTTENIDSVSVENMGILMFDQNTPEGDINTAEKVIKEVKTEGKYLVASTEAIKPELMGDTVYVKLFAELSDGSYVYSELMSYNAVRFAKTVLGNKNSSDEQKALMVALLNYGAEMQKVTDYKTDSLINASLTKAQKTLVADYSSYMADKVSTADKAKTAQFKKTGAGAVFYPVASLTDGFTFSYEFKVKNDDVSDVSLYYWTEEDYLNAETLTYANATKVISMTEADGVYTAEISVAAKNFDKTVYAAVVYSADGNTYSTGVVAYSMAELFGVYAENSSSDMQALSQAGIVYGYYAKNFFAN